MSCYVLYRHVLLFSFTHCRRHSVASVFHCEDLFLHWSSSSRVLTLGATLFSMVPTIQATMLLAFSQAGANGLIMSHPIVYGATVQATMIFSSFIGVNCLSSLRSKRFLARFV